MTKVQLQQILTTFRSKLADIRKKKNSFAATVIKRKEQQELHDVLLHIHDIEEH